MKHLEKVFETAVYRDFFRFSLSLKVFVRCFYLHQSFTLSFPKLILHFFGGGG